MGPKPRKPSAAEDCAAEYPISCKIMDILYDKQYLDKIRHARLNNELLQRFDYQAMESEIAKEKIVKLEDKVSSLEEEIDRLEQYSRRSNFRF